MTPPTSTIPLPPGAGGVPNYGGSPNYGGNVPAAGNPNFGGSPPIGGAPPFGGFPPDTGGDPGVAGFPNIGGSPAGTGGDPNVPPPPPPPPLTGKCNFKFDVTTVSYGGRFRPKNVGAIYVVSGSTLVSSLNVWGGTRLGNLTDWQALSGGVKTDAVTSATRSNAGPISGDWDCTDRSGNVVAAGAYQVCCSFQEDDALPFFGPAPKKACVDFTLPPTSSSIDAPDQQYFKSMHISIQ